jgi:hypothetical protein
LKFIGARVKTIITYDVVDVYYTSRGRKCYTKDGVLMITCSGVHVITVTEFVGKHLYILQKHSLKWLFSSFKNEF